QNLFRFEQSVLRFIRQSAMLNTRAEWSAAFESLRDEWLQLRDDEGEREAFDYFDFIAWVESKIQNRPLADVMNAKAG
ncbi:MAG: hypothetical protein ACE5DN_06335, partial [Flavobacteriales bacterium]